MFSWFKKKKKDSEQRERDTIGVQESERDHAELKP